MALVAVVVVARGDDSSDGHGGHSDSLRPGHGFRRCGGSRISSSSPYYFFFKIIVGIH